jgi:hypothetical protein
MPFGPEMCPIRSCKNTWAINWSVWAVISRAARPASQKQRGADRRWSCGYRPAHCASFGIHPLPVLRNERTLIDAEHRSRGDGPGAVATPSANCGVSRHIAGYVLRSGMFHAPGHETRKITPRLGLAQARFALTVQIRMWRSAQRKKVERCTCCTGASLRDETAGRRRAPVIAERRAEYRRSRSAGSTLLARSAPTPLASPPTVELPSL